MSGGVREGDPAPLRPDEVFQALTASMAVDATSRVAAQKRLQEWETDSTSGFVGSLLSIVQSGSEVVEVREGRWVGGWVRGGGCADAGGALYQNPRRHGLLTRAALVGNCMVDRRYSITPLWVPITRNRSCV